MKVFTKNLGFTLAEILLTLGIIGIVASMTIPPLINNANDTALKNQWKKDYTSINQATMSMMKDNGGSITNLFPDNNAVKNAFKLYLNVTKDCDEGASAGICWHADNTYYAKDGTPTNMGTAGGKPALMLADGSMMYFYKNDCTVKFASTDLYRCATVMVDVNGFKKPNVLGKDLFSARIMTDRVVPCGIPGDFGNLTCAEDTTGGWACSYEALYDHPFK